MGCSASKEEDLPIVSLCRRRRDLIRAASNRRYDLATAHASYFRALDRVGDALHRFVLEDLTAVSSPTSSPVLTLPPSKSKSKSDDSSGNGSGVNEDSRHLSSLTSSISLCSSSSGSEFSHHHHDPDPDPDPHGSEPEPEDSFHYPARHPPSPPPQFSSFVNPSYYYQDSVTEPYGYSNPQLNPNFYPDPTSSGQFPSFPSTNVYYMRKAATTPSTFYMDPNAGSFGFDYSNYYYDDFNPTIRDERGNADEPAAEKPAPAPPPQPEPVASGWDFFNVFDTYEQFLMNRDGRLGVGLDSRSGSFSSPDSSEIREKEGIPDLEEETDLESFREGEKKKEVGGFGGGSSKAAHLDELVEEKWKRTVLHENGSKEEMNGRKKGVSFEGGGSIKTDENGLGSSVSSSLVTEESGLSNGIEMHVHGVKDVVEAVEEIKQQFKSAAGCGDKVAKLLEVGKRQYQPRRTLLRGGYCIPFL